MAARTTAYPKAWLVLGGMAFGSYFAAGLAYFETFGLGMDQGWLFYLPVWAVLGLASVILALVLLAPERVAGKGLPGYVRWGILPLLGLGLAGLALWGYALAAGVAADGLLERLYFHMALVGLLPLQVALILVPQPRPLQDLPSNAPTTRPISTQEQSVTASDAAAAPPMLTIAASQGEAAFSVPVAELIAVEAADNYCKFHFVKAGQHKVKLLRLTLKEAEEALQGNAGFHRCHRSFLVNQAMVVEVLGGSQAHRLKLQYLEEPIPVSRSFDVETVRPSKD